ncbi:unnamed protein product [Adineta ricciae]|uniref:Glycosyltransferase family 92 protein n=1 Tax=Adineta ricciae TaxID=249248 RepID=A0A814WNR8_ADIRI|nr:unnamed protein product [Adineta ricciae]CAF1427410.1 unnamed protein product [Adineta ricciae]
MANRTSTFTTLILGVNNTNTTASRRTHFDYYICTQVWNETDEHLIEWIEHQIFRLGFRNVCVISVEEPLDKAIVTRYRLATITKAERAQEWKYCLECFTDPPMKPQDLLMLQDIDEFLNVQRSDAIAAHYDAYDLFHFTDLRYGYVYETDKEMENKSLLETNVYRRANYYLGEYIHPQVTELFECNGSCATTNGKEMIRVGAIEELGTHYHTANNRSGGKRLYIDMKDVRLNHYCMRTRENSLIAGGKWDKNGYKQDLIRLNNFFKAVYDPSIIYAKKLSPYRN